MTGKTYDDNTQLNPVKTTSVFTTSRPYRVTNQFVTVKLNIILLGYNDTRCHFMTL
jgi:hypothetical protein